MTKIRSRTDRPTPVREPEKAKKTPVAKTKTEKKTTAVQGTGPRRPTEASRKTARLAARTDPTTMQQRAKIQRQYDVPDEKDFHPKVSEAERTPEVVKKQEDAVKEAIRTGKPTSYETSEGQRVDVSVKKTEDGFRYRFNGNEVSVSFDDSYDEKTKEKTLARIVDYHAQSPTFAQSSFDKIRVDAANPESNTAASYSNRQIRFFGDHFVDEQTFQHEVGHAVGQKMTNTKSVVPEGWTEAVEKDGNEISGYGKESFDSKNNGFPGWVIAPIFGSDAASLRSDDFAESYQAYVEAQESGPEAVAAFEKKFPNRARFLAKQFGTMRDAPMPRDARTPVMA